MGSLGGLVTGHEVVHIETPFHGTDELLVNFGNCGQMVLEGGIQQEGWTIYTENNPTEPVNHWVYLFTIGIAYPQKS